MNFIQQAYKGKLGFWKYLVIPTLFFGMMILNYIAIEIFKIDQNELMRREILKKGENLVLIESLFPFVILLICLLLWVKFVHKQPITSLTTSRKNIDWNRFWFSFSIWGGITTLFVFVSYFLTPDKMIWNFQFNNFLGLVLIGCVLVPLQTSFEEYFFRGYLLQGIGAKFKSKFLALLLTSTTFGLLHIANPEVQKLGMVIMVYYIGTGLFLGIITLMDEGLELALGFHAANNLVTALLVTSNWTAFQTNSLFKDFSEPNPLRDIFIPVLLFFPFLLLIFSKKYGWKNWKEKLLGTVEKPLELQEEY